MTKYAGIPCKTCVYLFEAMGPVSNTCVLQEFDLQSIGKLPDLIQWRKYLDAWQRISQFDGILYPTYEQHAEAVAAGAADSTVKVLPFRVTCYRSGKHSFGSQDAARSFGGRLQDMFHWLVDLDDYELEIILDVTNSKNCRCYEYIF